MSPSHYKVKIEHGWKWKTIPRHRPTGRIIRGELRAHFKPIYAENRGTPPFGGFELLAWHLARRLHLPTPEYFIGTLEDGTKGIGSFLLPSPVSDWNEIPESLRAKDLIRQFRKPWWFAGVLVFDTLIGNSDRSAGNLLCQPVRKHAWQLYMIDHNNMFDLGQWLTGDYNHNDKLDFRAYIVPSNTKLYEVYDYVLRKHASYFEKYVSRVEGIRDREIHDMVASLPPEFFQPKYAQKARRILRARRDSIRKMFQDVL